MADNKKITELTLKATPASNDLLALVDVSGGNVTKKTTVGAFTPAAHAALTTTAHGGIVASTDVRLTNARTPTAHVHVGTDITTGTIDGDRLPSISTTKQGAVPATGSPTGKFLKDDGTFDAVPAYDLLIASLIY